MQRSKGFFLTLPSNSCLSTFPSNTVANFKVKPPESISLEGDWEVALVEMLYSHTWSTIREGNQQTFIYDVGTGYTTGLINSGHYNTVVDVVRVLNSCMTKEAKEKIKFSYVASKQKVQVEVPKGGEVLLTGDIATTLGFDNDTVITKKTISSYVADINGGFSTMFVYCNLVSNQIVGDKQVPLLRAVQIQGKYSDIVTKTYQNPLYIPIGIKNFETVEVDISDD